MGHQNYYLYLNQLFLLAFSGDGGCLSAHESARKKFKMLFENVV
jgi:hypothetical protein